MSALPLTLAHISRLHAVTAVSRHSCPPGSRGAGCWRCAAWTAGAAGGPAPRACPASPAGCCRCSRSSCLRRSPASCAAAAGTCSPEVACHNMQLNAALCKRCDPRREDEPAKHLHITVQQHNSMSHRQHCAIQQAPDAAGDALRHGRRSSARGVQVALQGGSRAGAVHAGTRAHMGRRQRPRAVHAGAQQRGRRLLVAERGEGRRRGHHRGWVRRRLAQRQLRTQRHMHHVSRCLVA